jgi:hypothetical protein
MTCLYLTHRTLAGLSRPLRLEGPALARLVITHTDEAIALQIDKH